MKFSIKRKIILFTVPLTILLWLYSGIGILNGMDLRKFAEDTLKEKLHEKNHSKGPNPSLDQIIQDTEYELKAINRSDIICKYCLIILPIILVFQVWILIKCYKDNKI